MNQPYDPIEERRRQRRIRAERRRRRNLAALIILALVLTALLVFLIVWGVKAIFRSDGSGQEQTTASVTTEAPTTESVDVNALKPEDRTPQASVTLLAVGDNLMHNTVMWSGEKGDGTYDFTPLYEYIQQDIEAADIACINQETIFIDDPSEYTNYPSFGGPTAIGQALIDVGFDVATHATNHCYDKYDQGIEDTIEFWRQHPEMTWLGIHDSQEDADTIRVVEKSGIKIAMLNYTYGTNAGQPSQSYMIDYLWDEDKIAADIEKAKGQSDIVIVFAHWGTENIFHADDDQIKWAQFFADHGVGAVIGGHTHTVQPVQTVTGKDGNVMPVFYSLGNFISHMSNYYNMLGGLARLTISRDEYGVYVSDYSLEPTMTWATKDADGYHFRAMKLSDYTEEMAQSHIIENTGVQTMKDLYDDIMS